MHFLVPAVKIALFYLLSSSGFFLFLAKLGRVKRERGVRLFLISLGLGPVFASWVLTMTVRLKPGMENGFYLSVVGLVLLVVSAWGWKSNSGVRHVLIEHLILWRPSLGQTVAEKCLHLTLWMLLLLLFVLALFAPITENDAIQYVVVAKTMFERHSLDFYPVIEPLPSGFYAVSSHPVGFMGLYLMTFMLQGASEVTIFIKIISPIYVLCTIAAFYGLLGPDRKLERPVAVLLLLSTPCYFSQASQLSIDSFRMYLLVAALFWALELTREETRAWRMATTVGIVTGLSMYSHSIGLLFSLPLVLPVVFLLGGPPLGARMSRCLIITTVALVLGGYRIVENLMLFGTPIYDHLPVYDLERIHYDEYVWYSSYLFNVFDKVIKGLLKGFSSVRAFGAGYWIFAFVSIALLFNRRGLSRDFMCCLLVIFLFYCAVVLSMLLDMHVFIANFRYLMTVQPFVALAAAIGVGAYARSDMVA